MTFYDDVSSVDLIRILNHVTNEHIRQTNKWGSQDDRTLNEWLNYIVEEVGELATAISDYEYHRNGSLLAIHDEAIQVAALSSRLAAIVHAAEVSELMTEMFGE